MGKALHELLAAEKQVASGVNKLMSDTAVKFSKSEYFQGYTKSLKMLNDSPENATIEAAQAENRQLTTTVQETLAYLFKYWANKEDLLLRKSAANQRASGTIIFRDKEIATNIPVDELLGLEDRLKTLRSLMDAMPTLHAALRWEEDALASQEGAWIASSVEVTTKTQKITTPVVLYAATKEHPAQVKESSEDVPVGRFTVQRYSGAASSAQKAEVLSTIDELIIAVKQARMRANQEEVGTEKIGETITSIIMQAFAK